MYDSTFDYEFDTAECRKFNANPNIHPILRNSDNSFTTSQIQLSPTKLPSHMSTLQLVKSSVSSRTFMRRSSKLQLPTLIFLTNSGPRLQLLSQIFTTLFRLLVILLPRRIYYMIVSLLMSAKPQFFL